MQYTKYILMSSVYYYTKDNLLLKKLILIKLLNKV